MQEYDGVGDGDLQSSLATLIIPSLKSVINERADILDKGIEKVKMSVEFLTEEIKYVKEKVERVDKRVTTAEKRIGEQENKVGYRISPDIRGESAPLRFALNNQEKMSEGKFWIFERLSSQHLLANS